MKALNKQVLLVFFVLQIITVLASLIISLLTVPAVIDSLKLSWLVSNTLIVWMSLFMYVSLVALLLAASLSVFNPSFDSLGLQHKLSSASVIIILLIASFFIVYSFLFEGMVTNQRSKTLNLSAQIEEDLSQARADLASKKYFEAEDIARNLVRMMPEDMELKNFYERIVREISDQGLRGFSSAPGAKEAAETKAIEEIDLNASLGKAREYLDKQDYFTALYFLNLADRTRSNVQAAHLWLEAEEGVGGSIPDSVEESQTQRFLLKRSAILDEIPLEHYEKAYTLLLQVDDLARKEGFTPLPVQIDLNNFAPKTLSQNYADPDVKIWMPFVMENLSNQVFFESELEHLREYGLKKAVIFRNSSDLYKNIYVYFKSIAQADYNIFYVEAPEILAFDSQGKVIYHIRSKAGKISNSDLFMRSISLDGTRKNEVEILEGPEDLQSLGAIFHLNWEGQDLYSLAYAGLTGRELSVLDRFALLPRMAEAGLASSGLETALLDDLSRIMSFISLMVLALALGISLRSRYEEKPVFLIIISLPLLALVSIIGLDYYQEFLQTFNRFLLSHNNFDSSLMYSGIFQAVQLIICLFILAMVSMRTD